jgi:glycerol kinase
LEAVAFQNAEIVESMNKDSRTNLKMLQVSGGMSKNKLLLQIQADYLGIPVGMSMLDVILYIRPSSAVITFQLKLNHP